MTSREANVRLKETDKMLEKILEDMVIFLSSKLSEKVKSRFCKDCNIPINIFIEPYFSQRLILLDKYYNCLESFNKFIKFIEKCGSEEEMIESVVNVRNQLINFLKAHPAVKSLANHDMQEFDVSDYKQKMSSKNVYTDCNCNIPMISIDLKHGNFTALKWYAKNYQSGFEKDFESYKDFVLRFTNEEYIINSKSLRQAVFGNCCPRRFESIQKHLLTKIIDKLSDRFKTVDIISHTFFVSSDELLIVPNENCDKNQWFDIISEVLREFKTEEGVSTKVQMFFLTKGKMAKGYFKNIEKEITFDKEESVEENFVKLKTFSKKSIPFAVRELKNQEIKDSDCYFIDDEKNLCKIII